MKYCRVKIKFTAFQITCILINKIYNIASNPTTNIQKTNQHQVDDGYSEYVKCIFRSGLTDSEWKTKNEIFKMKKDSEWWCCLSRDVSEHQLKYKNML
jgi:hypothetical protein